MKQLVLIFRYLILIILTSAYNIFMLAVYIIIFRSLNENDSEWLAEYGTFVWISFFIMFFIPALLLLQAITKIHPNRILAVQTVMVVSLIWFALHIIDTLITAVDDKTMTIWGATIYSISLIAVGGVVFYRAHEIIKEERETKKAN